MAVDLHAWNVTPAEARRIQEEWAPRISLKNELGKIRLIAGADMSLIPEDNMGFAVMVLFSFPQLEVIEEQFAAMPVPFPYVPGLLSFREAPILLEAFKKLREKPDAILFDGQGVAHPRGMGIASHMGLWLDLPTVGCAKSLLVGSYAEPGKLKGSASDLTYRGRKIGTVLRTRDGVKPIFVSPGHKMDFDGAARLALQCCDGYRVPKPTRYADRYADKVKRLRPSPQPL